MVDVLGNEVEVGDKVLFIPNHYKELLIGTITNVTSVRVKIKFSKSSSYIKASNQFVKI